jgi:hypothetical protein
MVETILDRVDAIEGVRVAMENRHCLAGGSVALRRRIGTRFLPMDEPHGLVCRHA